MTDFSIELAVHPPHRAAALTYVATQMQQVFECTPPPTPGLILLARDSSGIVGSMAIENIAHDPCSLETRYRIAPDLFEKTNRLQGVVGARWTATRTHVGAPLFRAACVLAHSLGKQFMLIEAKPAPIRRFRQLGIPFTPVSASLDTEATAHIVGATGMRYFIEPPYPALYILSFSAMRL